MNELERLALQHIRQLAKKADCMLTETAVKSHNETIKIDATKDIYPIGSIMHSIDNWAEAILKNK